MLHLTELIHSISAELEVDRVNDDVTVKLLGETRYIPASAVIRSKDAGVFSGITIVEAFSSLFEGQIKFQPLVKEGDRVEPSQEIVRLEGPAGLCLSIERTLINYLSHLSGVATLTRRFVDAVKPHPTHILATRKTLPGLRYLQLQAVVAGGGRIHRRNLSDGILIKENHQIFCGGLDLLRASETRRSPLHRTEIEVQDFETLERIVQNSPDVIMLDNFSDSDLPRAIQKIRMTPQCAQCRIEVSGGMNLERVAKVASLGVDYISVGRLTHSSPSLNMSLDIEKANPAK